MSLGSFFIRKKDQNVYSFEKRTIFALCSVRFGEFIKIKERTEVFKKFILREDTFISYFIYKL